MSTAGADEPLAPGEWRWEQLSDGVRCRWCRENDLSLAAFCLVIAAQFGFSLWVLVGVLSAGTVPPLSASGLVVCLGLGVSVYLLVLFSWESLVILLRRGQCWELRATTGAGLFLYSPSVFGRPVSISRDRVMDIRVDGRLSVIAYRRWHIVVAFQTPRGERRRTIYRGRSRSTMEGMARALQWGLGMERAGN